MIIYLCIKFESNTLIFSENIETGQMGQDRQTWHIYVQTAVILYATKNIETGQTGQDRQTWHIYIQTAVILYAPPPSTSPHPIEYGGA